MYIYIFYAGMYVCVYIYYMRTCKALKLAAGLIIFNYFMYVILFSYIIVSKL